MHLVDRGHRQSVNLTCWRELVIGEALVSRASNVGIKRCAIEVQIPYSLWQNIFAVFIKYTRMYYRNIIDIIVL